MDITMASRNFKIEANGLKKQFNRVTLFSKVSFSVETGGSLCLTGHNGSGKTTLLKIIAGLHNPTAGSVSYTDVETGRVVPDWSGSIGYTGPLVNPYDDLTADENIHFAVNGMADASRVDALLELFNLIKHRDKKIKFFSSGMKQRLKLILAVINDRPVLLFDEPGTNLDQAGKDSLYSYLDSVRREKIIIIATNEKNEEQICTGGIRLG